MPDTRETILAAARLAAQAHGYGGLNFRDLAAEVGIKSASLHHHFPTKADLGAAVARRYWEDSKKRLEELRLESGSASVALARYPLLFRKALENENRMCLCGFMAAEQADLPVAVASEVRAFADIQIAWLIRVLKAIDPDLKGDVLRQRAKAIFAAIGGAQLMARGQADIAVYDEAIEGYRRGGLLPAEAPKASRARSVTRRRASQE